MVICLLIHSPPCLWPLAVVSIFCRQSAGKVDATYHGSVPSYSVFRVSHCTQVMVLASYRIAIVKDAKVPFLTRSRFALAFVYFPAAQNCCTPIRCASRLLTSTSCLQCLVGLAKVYWLVRQWPGCLSVPAFESICFD